MSNRRRRANDFTDSLSSFRQTASDEELNQAVSQTSLEDKIDSIRYKQVQSDKHSLSRNNEFHVNSIILAGNLANQQCILAPSCNTAGSNYNTAYNNRWPLSRDTLNVSDETSYLSIKLDLNKCINLFHNEHLCKGHDNLKQITMAETTVSEDINPCHFSKNKTMEQRNFNNHRRSMSAESLNNIILLNQGLRRSKSHTMLNKAPKRDTNYNIKGDQLSVHRKNAVKVSQIENVETVIPSLEALMVSRPALSSRKDDCQYTLDSISSENSSNDDLNPFELKTLLHSLGSQTPLKEAAVQQRLLRRLSTNYYDSPKVFTEGLLTIIEESIINNDSKELSQYPGNSSRRFNEELKKMCKFIEDETVPEWPQSPSMSTSMYARRKSQEIPKSDLLRKSFGAFASPEGLHLATSASPRLNIKSPKKIHRRMSKNTYTARNLHDSTTTFESLEAMCKKLYPDDYNTPPAFERIERTRIQSSSQSMDSIWRVCESQMASLEDSPNILEQVKKAGMCTIDLACQHEKTPKSQDPKNRLLPSEKYNRTGSKRASDTFKRRIEKCKHQEMSVELDDLESTLLYEIAKKRQRCFDTPKAMLEIDANLESIQTPGTYPNIIITEPSPTKADDKFMQTLMSVKKYQDYLEEHKSVLNLLHRVRLNSPRDRKDIRVKKRSNDNFVTGTSLVSSGNKSTLRTPRLSLRKKSTSSASAKPQSSSKTVVSKPRLFFTPEKTSVNKGCKPKRTYFPDFLPTMNKQKKLNISPHAKSIYRQMGNYDHVVSPIGTYIKGTEPHQKKNLQRKREEMLRIPKKKQTIRLPSPKFQFPLSPERPKEKLTVKTVRDENVAGNIAHSKMSYKFPSHASTMKEPEK